MKTHNGFITELRPNEIFVYGANVAGIHGAGAAKQALKWGAVWGQYGLNGQTYGIPTKDRDINTLTLKRIEKFVQQFMIDVSMMPEKEFLVTEIGCGLAGYTPKEIAPLFRLASHFGNIAWPRTFAAVLDKVETVEE